jgi:hypothetical protein
MHIGMCISIPVCHDLEVHGPGGRVLVADGIVQVSDGVVRIRCGDSVDRVRVKG